VFSTISEHFELKERLLETYKCPHCNDKGISFMRKMCLGPALPATCKCCGKKVGIPYMPSLLAGVPFVASIILGFSFDDFSMHTGGVILGWLVYSIIHIKMIPLEPR
jgi:hypothetical protein